MSPSQKRPPKGSRDRVDAAGSQKLTQAKDVIKKSLAKRGAAPSFESEPEMAIDVLDEKLDTGKPLEQALVAEHLFRRTIEKSIPIGIAAFDIQWHQIYVNRMFCKMVGWHEEELINAPFPQPYWILQGVSGSPVIPQKSVLEKIVQCGKIEIAFRRKDGGRLWGLVFSEAIADSTGRVGGYMISVTDIGEQKNTQDALRKVTAELINAQENERKHFAHDLHDSIGGKLTGIKYSLEKIMSDTDPSLTDLHRFLEGALAAVRSTIEETQRIIKNLHPSMIEDLGLAPAIKAHCREFEQFYSSLEIQKDFDIEEKEVPDAIKILIYRVLQEALNNVAKHSKARSVRIDLKRIEGNIVLTVEDDGIGFDAQEITGASASVKNIGLESMRERTELFGGTFSLQSRQGGGTKIQGTWPLQAP